MYLLIGLELLWVGLDAGVALASLVLDVAPERAEP